MSTPKNPGPRLPDRPVGPPTIAREVPAAAVPADTAGTLERLKAAKPRATSPVDDGGPGRARPASGTSVDQGRPSRPPAGRPPASDPTAPARQIRQVAGRARTAAGSTGRALSRGGSAAARSVGSWDSDLVRQAVVTACAVACILGSAAGVGAFGGPPIRDAAGGLFAPDSTLLAPSSSAFSVWSVIYAGLGAYTAFQWLPSQRTTDRQRRLGWIVAASMLLNLAWILSAQSDRPTLSLVVILLLFFALLAAVQTLNDHPNESRLEGALVDTPLGLYLGWVLVATAANGAAFLTARDAGLFGWAGTTWAVIGIVVVLMSAAVVCSTDRGRLSVAAATSWGLLWIAVERVLGEPVAVDVAFVAVLAIFLLLITAGSRRHRVDHAHRRRLRAQEDALREPVNLLGDDYQDSRY